MNKNILILLLILCGNGFTQKNEIKRKYIPIIFTGRDLPIKNMKIDEWSAFKYDQTTGNWQQIPFQIDQVFQGEYNKKDKYNDIIDDHDELLFMPEDIGDRAPVSEWNLQNKKQKRIEIELSDSLNAYRKGWIYLYSTPQVEKPPGYFDYVPASSEASDTVKTDSYHVGHNKDGWIDFVSLSQDNKLDLIDRLKLRLKGEPTIPLFQPYVLTEDFFEAQQNPITFYPGPIRFFRDLRTHVKLPFSPVPLDADYGLQYFPYSLNIGVIDAKIDATALALIGLKSLRQSIDFNRNAEGMYFYSSALEEQVILDGNPDNVAEDIQLDSGKQWFMASGRQGSIILVLNLPKIDNAKNSIYYRDSETVGTDDNTIDTGDQISIGDMGILITTEGAGLQTNKLTMNLSLYLLDEPRIKPELAEKLVLWESYPLKINALEQTYSTTWVEQKANPESYKLYPAYPNPFNPLKQKIQISFITDKQLTMDTRLVIYNILGRTVKQIPISRAFSGFYQSFWDGRDENGNLVAPGIYLYQLQIGNKLLNERIFVYHE